MIQTSGVGSLPFTSVVEAVQYGFSVDLPYLTQLPPLAEKEKLLVQGVAGLELENCSLGNEFATWKASLEQLMTLQSRKFKMQFPGAYCLQAYGKIPFDHRLTRRLHCYIDYFRQRNIEVLIVLDEPAIADPNTFEKLYHNFFGVLPTEDHKHIGIHCCGDVSWHHILELPFAALSFDSALHLATLVSPDNLKRIENNVHTLLPGIIPTDWDNLPDNFFDSQFLALNPLLHLDKKIYLTAACGHGLRSASQALFARKQTKLAADFFNKKLAE